MRGVSVPISTRRSMQANWGRCRAKNDVPSRNVYENKENKVSGVRCEVSGAHLGSEVQAGGFETVQSEKRRSKPECV